VKRTSTGAYPRVISNLGGLMDGDLSKVAVKMIRFMNHYARDISEKHRIIKYFADDQYTPPVYRTSTGAMQPLPDSVQAFDRQPALAVQAAQQQRDKLGTSSWLTVMYDYYPVGYANTLGYAHPNSGDTMTTVMIGGLRTVLNGDFEIFAGDLVQFYW